MKLHINSSLTSFIDTYRGVRCRADYILKCVSYIRDNNIDINDYYEGMSNNEEFKRINKERKNID